MSLQEFLAEAELGEYLSALVTRLKVSTVEHLKYVQEDDLQQIGMTRPEMRRLHKFYKRHSHQGAISKIRKAILKGGGDGTGRTVSTATRPQRETQALPPSVAPMRLPGKHIIPADAIQLGRTLGRGEFGLVQQGVWKTDLGKTLQVAVKRVSKERMNSGSQNFLKEAAIMQDVHHQHIVQMFGVMLDGEDNIMLVTELAPMRSLLECIKDISLRSDLPVTRLCDYAIQVCDGMSYLENKRLVHRDLAARNILVFNKNLVKISDLGLSRLLGVGQDYYQSRFSASLKLPIAWCAPECINFLKFTPASDVWSFGVLLWEFFTYGFQPWAGLSGQQILQAIDEPNCQRLDQPELCTSDIYKLMRECWAHDPEDRPMFSDVLLRLPQLKPTQVKALKDYPRPVPEKGYIPYRTGDVIAVINKSAVTSSLPGWIWKGVLANGNSGLFDPTNAVPFVEPNASTVPGQTISIVRKESTRRSGKKIRVDMISHPHNDMRHTGHIGYDGAVFGDVAFIADNYDKLPVKAGLGNTSQDPAALSFGRGSPDHEEYHRYTNSQQEGVDKSGYGQSWISQESMNSQSSCQVNQDGRYSPSYLDIEDDTLLSDFKVPSLGSSFDFGPSFMDEVLKALDEKANSECASSPGRSFDPNIWAASARREPPLPAPREPRAAASATSSTLSAGQPHRLEHPKEKKQTRVKSMSASDERMVDTALARARELTSHMIGGSAQSPPVSPSQGPSFFGEDMGLISRLKNSIKRSSSPKNEHKRNFSDDLEHKGDLDEVSPEAQQAYNMLVVKGSFKEKSNSGVQHHSASHNSGHKDHSASHNSGHKDHSASHNSGHKDHSASHNSGHKDHSASHNSGHKDHSASHNSGHKDHSASHNSGHKDHSASHNSGHKDHSASHNSGHKDHSASHNSGHKEGPDSRRTASRTPPRSCAPSMLLPGPPSPHSSPPSHSLSKSGSVSQARNVSISAPVAAKTETRNRLEAASCRPHADTQTMDAAPVCPDKCEAQRQLMMPALRATEANGSASEAFKNTSSSLEHPSAQSSQRSSTGLRSTTLGSDHGDCGLQDVSRQTSKPGQDAETRNPSAFSNTNSFNKEQATCLFLDDPSPQEAMQKLREQRLHIHSHKQQLAAENEATTSISQVTSHTTPLHGSRVEGGSEEVDTNPLRMLRGGAIPLRTTGRSSAGTGNISNRGVMALRVPRLNFSRHNYSSDTDHQRTDLATGGETAANGTTVPVSPSPQSQAAVVMTIHGEDESGDCAVADVRIGEKPIDPQAQDSFQVANLATQDTKTDDHQHNVSQEHYTDLTGPSLETRPQPCFHVEPCIHVDAFTVTHEAQTSADHCPQNPIVSQDEGSSPRPIVSQDEGPSPRPIVSQDEGPSSRPIVSQDEGPSPHLIVSQDEGPSPHLIVSQDEGPSPRPIVSQDEGPSPRPIVSQDEGPSPRPIVRQDEGPSPHLIVSQDEGPSPHLIVSQDEGPSPCSIVIQYDGPSPHPIVSQDGPSPRPIVSQDEGASPRPIVSQDGPSPPRLPPRRTQSLNENSEKTGAYLSVLSEGLRRSNSFEEGTDTEAPALPPRKPHAGRTPLNIRPRERKFPLQIHMTSQDKDCRQQQISPRPNSKHIVQVKSPAPTSPSSPSPLHGRQQLLSATPSRQQASLLSHHQPSTARSPSSPQCVPRHRQPGILHSFMSHSLDSSMSSHLHHHTVDLPPAYDISHRHPNSSDVADSEPTHMLLDVHTLNLPFPLSVSLPPSADLSSIDEPTHVSLSSLIDNKLSWSATVTSACPLSAPIIHRQAVSTASPRLTRVFHRTLNNDTRGRAPTLYPDSADSQSPPADLPPAPPTPSYREKLRCDQQKPKVVRSISHTPHKHMPHLDHSSPSAFRARSASTNSPQYHSPHTDASHSSSHRVLPHRSYPDGNDDDTFFAEAPADPHPYSQTPFHPLLPQSPTDGSHSSSVYSSISLLQVSPDIPAYLTSSSVHQANQSSSSSSPMTSRLSTNSSPIFRQNIESYDKPSCTHDTPSHAHDTPSHAHDTPSHTLDKLTSLQLAPPSTNLTHLYSAVSLPSCGHQSPNSWRTSTNSCSTGHRPGLQTTSKQQFASPISNCQQMNVFRFPGAVRAGHSLPHSDTRSRNPDLSPGVDDTSSSEVSPLMFASYSAASSVSYEDLRQFAFDRQKNCEEIETLLKIFSDQVTVDECMTALESTQWDVARATKYLQLKKLLSLGVADVHKCKEALSASGWDLQCAAETLLESSRTVSAAPRGNSTIPGLIPAHNRPSTPEVVDV